MNLKQLSSVAALLFLAACAQPNLPQQNSWQAAEQVQDFSVDGRLAVKVEGKGSYANFDWTYQNAVQTIDVNTPLGNTVGQLCQDSEGVLAVDSKGKVYQAETAEEYLHIWADGKRVANAPYKILPDGRLEQFDWTISRTLNSSGQPKTLQLENAKFNIRLVFDTVNHSLDKNGQTRCAARK